MKKIRKWILLFVVAFFIAGCDRETFELTLEDINREVEVGETIHLVWENKTDYTVSWHSSDETIAIVENGVLTAIGIGEVQVTLRLVDTNHFVSIDVMVIPKTAITSETLSIVLRVGERQTLLIHTAPEDSVVLLEGYNTNLIAIDGFTVLGLERGETTIVARLEDSNKSISISVVVMDEKRLEYMGLNPIILEYQSTYEIPIVTNVEEEIVIQVADTDIVAIEGRTLVAIKAGTTEVTIDIIGRDAPILIPITVEPRVTEHVVHTIEEWKSLFSNALVYPMDLVYIESTIEFEEDIIISKPLTIHLTGGSIVTEGNIQIIESDVSIFGYEEHTIVANECWIYGKLEISHMSMLYMATWMKENSSLHVLSDASLGMVNIEENATNIMIRNDGEILAIDARSMNYDILQSLIIHQYGTFTDQTAAILLSEEASTVNTYIYRNHLAPHFYVVGSLGFTTFDVDSEFGNYVIPMFEDEHSYYVRMPSSNLRLETNLRESLSIDQIQGVKTLIIHTHHTGLLNASDFAFLNSDSLLSLEKLDLSDAIISQNYIPQDAMRGKLSLKELILPNTITSIGSHAFFETNIMSIHIPKAVITIGLDAFGYSSNTQTYVKEVHIAHDVPLMGEFAYGFSPRAYYFVPEQSLEEYHQKWASLRKLEPFVYRYYNERLFAASSKIEDYFIREVEGGVEIVLYVGELVKEGMIPENFVLEGANLPVVSIGPKAFRYVTNPNQLAANIVFPATVHTIGNYAFYEFSTISALDLANVVMVGAYAFEFISYTFTSIVGREVKTIHTHAFNGLRNVLEVDFPKLEYLGDYAMQNMVSLTELAFPNLRFIGSGAISNCINLEVVHLGSVEECGSWVISNLNKMRIWDFTHDSIEPIFPTFGAGWRFPSSVVVYVNEESFDYFVLLYPTSNIIIKETVE